MDLDNCSQHHALFTDALALHYHPSYYPKGIRQFKMDRHVIFSAYRLRNAHLLCLCMGGADDSVNKCSNKGTSTA